jgi:uncharacterized membrane protein YhiD involved in acid resistance
MSLRTAASALVVAAVLAAASAQASPPSDLLPSPAAHPELRSEADPPKELMRELRDAGLRLPLALALGSALALRPRRRGNPRRSAHVVQTQIILAVVGAVVMLIVGASLARAFGVVGVASLIRYRTKIDDPKDSVVMLAALAVGLASGAGFYVLAGFSTVFLVAVLGVIERLEPQTRTFELSVKLGDQTAALRPRIEAVLRRLQVKYELRGVSEEGVSYLVTAPSQLRTDEASKALTALGADDKGAVEWGEISKMKAS